MTSHEAALRFEGVSFSHGPKLPILTESDFVVRRGAKLSLMGQNGAGKSTLFGLITGAHKPEEGRILRANSNATVAIAKQIIPREQLDYTVREFFEAGMPEKVYALDPMIQAVLEVVNVQAPLDKKLSAFSGGQQARLLLASALIHNPDILLLDEPTNNLDDVGIQHLTDFLIGYKKTCIVISHDAAFLNAFTTGVLYLDVRTHTIEQYNGTYNDVLREITARIEKENMKNAQLEKQIQANKDKANFFANKGGQMRLVAKRMRDKAEEMEEAKVDVRKEDKTIRPFSITPQTLAPIEVMHMTSYSTMRNQKVVIVKKNHTLARNEHLHLVGPNGSGKSHFLASLAAGRAEGATLAPGVKVGYYTQDFSHLDFSKTVFQTLMDAMQSTDEQHMRSVAAGFLITGALMHVHVGNLSEGQKGLVAFAKLTLERPNLLILDEPTNHINFRHIPVIAKALSEFEGALILVSHVPDFVQQIRIDTVLELK